MKIFLPCWGEKHISLLERCLLRSLLWEKNKKAVSNADWLIVTADDEEAKKIKSLLQETDPKSVRSFTSENVRLSPGTTLLQSIKETIKLCLKEEDSLLMATPDYIYGNGTIDAFKKLAGKTASVSLAHMRVTPEILEPLRDGAGNAEIMSLAKLYPHSSWSLSDEALGQGVTYFGGISWSKIDEKLVAVRHRLPAPFFVNFNESDLEFFSKTHNHPHDHTFALWDHLWQSHLISQGRFRYVGSSDVALMVEVTDRFSNIPTTNPYGKSNQDEYCNNYPHNEICKQFLSVFRSQ